MANRNEPRENALTQYRREFDIWLFDFKKTDTYTDIVANYEEDWSKIYKELHGLFKEKVWYPMKSENKTPISNDDPKLRIYDPDELKNYRRQFDEWATSSVGPGYRQYDNKINTELHRIFQLTFWNPEKNVDTN